MDAPHLFETELRRRAIPFDVDGRQYLITLSTRQLLVNLDNLQCQLRDDGRDAERAASFAEAVISAGETHAPIAEQIFWYLEPNDYVESATYRYAVSPRLDRVLAHVSGDGTLISWVTDADLRQLGLTPEAADDLGWANLDRLLEAARVETRPIDGVSIAFLHVDFPSKASLILAPSLRELVADAVGWPVLAVLPDRDFLYLWSADHRDFASQIGRTVLHEYDQAPYPLSLELFEIDDAVRPIGAFTP